MCNADWLTLCPQASCILQLVKYIQKLQQKDVEVAEEVNALFAGELNPVAPKAQKKVPVPEGSVCFFFSFFPLPCTDIFNYS